MVDYNTLSTLYLLNFSFPWKNWKHFPVWNINCIVNIYLIVYFYPFYTQQVFKKIHYLHPFLEHWLLLQLYLFSPTLHSHQTLKPMLILSKDNKFLILLEILQDRYGHHYLLWRNCSLKPSKVPSVINIYWSWITIYRYLTPKSVQLQNFKRIKCILCILAHYMFIVFL